jgi:hypothetical protein
MQNASTRNPPGLISFFSLPSYRSVEVVAARKAAPDAPDPALRKRVPERHLEPLRPPEVGRERALPGGGKHGLGFTYGGLSVASLPEINLAGVVEGRDAISVVGA